MPGKLWVQFRRVYCCCSLIWFQQNFHLFNLVGAVASVGTGANGQVCGSVWDFGIKNISLKKSSSVPDDSSKQQLRFAFSCTPKHKRIKYMLNTIVAAQERIMWRVW